MNMSENKFIILEEEASIINYFKNSKKIKRDEEQSESNGGASKGSGVKKTMMELIAESLQEQADKQI